MEFSRLRNIFVVLLMMAVLTTAISFVLQSKNSFAGQIVSVSNNLIFANTSVPSNNLIPPKKLDNPPEIIKAIYITGNSAGAKAYLNYLTNLFKTTEINAVVVDIKPSTGYLNYNSGAEEAKIYGFYKGAIKDIDALVRFFHNQNIYVIGRISVFEDPMYSKARPDLAVYNKILTTDPAKPVLWKDNNGLSWLDPSSKTVWDYNISLAKDAFYHGFDEINFDYVRFPSDGRTENMVFPFWNYKTPKAQVIKNFFDYTRQQLTGEKLSVDLFGQATINKDDMGIGQLIENAFENFDYISPMLYPSHYAVGFLGFASPAEHPYEIVKYSMDKALIKKQAYAKFLLDISSAGVTVDLAKFRPWLQDFNMGAIYNSEMVKQQIKATEDSLGGEYSGFMLWNPSNIYTANAVKLEPNK